MLLGILWNPVLGVRVTFLYDLHKIYVGTCIKNPKSDLHSPKNGFCFWPSVAVKWSLELKPCPKYLVACGCSEQLQCCSKLWQWPALPLLHGFKVHVDDIEYNGSIKKNNFWVKIAGLPLVSLYRKKFVIQSFFKKLCKLGGNLIFFCKNFRLMSGLYWCYHWVEQFLHARQFV